ncbi:MAG TPA: coproporphyrinogen-III oxidase family protein [Gemmataceae bacterium]|nr:coproporphyrinogen-III oxidase family protein [Gemmataceae bacterium]
MTAVVDQEKTGLGNYFIANYPPFSFWKPNYVEHALGAINAPPKPGVPLGLYLHIPFCRKRCKFCYFRVYTDKNASDISVYLDAITKEVELLSKSTCVGGRPLDYVYFGGGTPSYLSATQLDGLMTRLREIMPWDQAREVTFECEPGTLQKHKLEMLKKHGVTRLSLGVENFKPEILQYNGRAHLEEEIYRAFGWARELAFEQINLDLIAGMVGEDWDNWRTCVAKTIAMAPDCVTIYQMELPYNTVFSKELRKDEGGRMKDEEDRTSLDVLHPSSLDLHPSHVADWPTKREWTRYAFDELVKAGYAVSSATTVVKNPEKTRFVYREALWRGADMFGTGVASFGHVSGVHIQNVDTWEQYIEKLNANELPLGRAFPTTERDRLIREIVLQLKTGHLDAGYFRQKYGVDIRDEFRRAFDKLTGEGWLTIDGESIDTTRAGLMQIDRHLTAFFDPQYISNRYT